MRSLSLQQINYAISQHIDVSRINENCRKQEVVLPRQIAHYFSKNFTKHPLWKIGKFFGNKDHATVIHSSKTIQNYIDTDKTIREIILNINNDLLNFCPEEDDLLNLCVNCIQF